MVHEQLYIMRMVQLFIKEVHVHQNQKKESFVMVDTATSKCAEEPVHTHSLLRAFSDSTHKDHLITTF